MSEGGYDGTIRIGTKIDQAGFNVGVKNMRMKIIQLRTTMKALFSIIPALGKQLLQAAASAITSLAAAAAAAAVALFTAVVLGTQKMITGLRDAINDLIENDLKGTKIAEAVANLKSSFVELRASVAAAFLPLVEIAIPYIQKAVDWLIGAANKVGMIIAAFAGQKRVLQIVAGSAAKLAKNAKDTEKATKNTLAAFDEISVLQRNAGEVDENPATVLTEMVPITDDILTKVQAIKDEIAEWWADPIGKIKETWGKIAAWFKENVIDPIANWWSNTWLSNNFFEPILAWAWEAWENIKLGAQIAWLFITNAAGLAAAKIQEIWNNVKEWFTLNVFIPLVVAISNAFYTIGVKLGEAKEWFFSTLDAIGQKWRDVFTGVQNFVKSTIDNILGFLARMVTSILEGIAQITGLKTPNAPDVGGATGAVKLPHLATGAVIPPNSAFAAIVGDNTRENEILAPESKLLQMAQEIADRVAGSGGGMIENTIILEGEAIYRAVKRVDRRRGTSLITGGVVG